jgi:hypothetical protein
MPFPMIQRRHWWRVLKWTLILAILAGVGWQFVRILRAPELQNIDPNRSATAILWDQIRDARPGWLLISGVLYVLGLGFPALYWSRLQRHLGQQSIDPLTLCRAYYVSHVGKYVPGKAWALLLRATLIGGPRERAAIAGMAAFYEVLTTMTGGALFAALLFAVLIPDRGPLPDWTSIKDLFSLHLSDETTPGGSGFVMLSLFLALPVGVPLIPAIYNRLVQRTTSPFRRAEAAPLPDVRLPYLLEGLVLSCGTWLLFGASLAAVFHAVLKQPPDWTLSLWGRQTAFFAVGYVASFLIFVVPGSIGVREYFVAVLLVPEIVIETGLDRAEASVAVLVSVVILRFVWFLAELLMAGLLLWIPRRA